MFKFGLQLTPKFMRIFTPYNLPVEDMDVVKVRTTHEGTQESEFKGKTGRVVSQMHMVTVEFEDGSVGMFNRDELNLRIPGLADAKKGSTPKEPWQE